MIPVSDLLRRLDTLMLDEDKVRWPDAERIDWFNDGAKEIVARRPAARALRETVVLVAGTAQRANPGAAQVLDVPRNLGPNGEAGRAIRITDRQQLDDANPDWHMDKPARTVHFMVDERNPTEFSVWPPAAAGAKVEVLASRPPPDATSADDSIDLRPEFINALLNWALFRCHTKDSEYAQGSVMSLHYQAFTAAIGEPALAAAQNSATGNST